MLMLMLFVVVVVVRQVFFLRVNLEKRQGSLVRINVEAESSRRLMLL